MNNVIPVVLLSLMCFGIACSNSKKVNNGDSVVTQYSPTKIPVNIEKPITNNFDSIYSFDKLIQLETNELCFITELTKVVVTPDSLLSILDKKQQSIFIFNFSGEFLTAIKRLGGGPEEYRNIKDFTYNPVENSIVVLDLGTQSLLHYSLPTGKFLKRTKIQPKGNYGYTIDYLSGNYVFNRQNLAPEVHLGQLVLARSIDLTVVGSGIPQNEAIVNSPVDIPHPLDIVDSIAYSLDFLNDTIYRIDKASIEPVYYLDYSPANASKMAKALMNGDNDFGDNYMGELFADEGIWGFSSLFAVNDLFYFSFNFKNKTFVNIFDRNKFISYPVSSFPILQERYFINPPITKFGNILISSAIEKDNSAASLEKNPLLCLYQINKEKLN